MKLEFSRQILGSPQIQNFMKIRPLGVAFHADGQADRRTEMTKLVVPFLKFANVPKNCVQFKEPSVHWNQRDVLFIQFIKN
jgi:hypothetical protein